MKPFDLEAALDGTPVKLRDGSKAYVLYHELLLHNTDYQLLGYREIGSVGHKAIAWTERGEYCANEESPQDIIGMWADSPLTFDHWGLLQPQWRFVAKDADGSIWLYDAEPDLCTDVGWWEPNAGKAIGISEVITWDTSGRHWTATLVGRPE